MIEIEHAPAEAARHALPSELIHELRTPLNQIIGYSDMLLEHADDKKHAGLDGDLVPDLQKVRAAGHRLQAIIEDNFYPVRGACAPETRSTDDAHPAREEQGHPLPSTAKSTDMARQYVLVVDDIEANRDVLTRRLESQGYSVAGAQNGRHALEMLAAQPFDLVLLDIMMPEMDGYEVLQILKSDASFSHIPVIVVSALSEMESVARCVEMGAEDYLTKPFNPTLLKARVGACLGKKLARDREMELLREVQDSYRHLLALEAMRDDLTHMIIHDLRTPLTSVMAGVQTMAVVGDLNADQREVLAIAVAGGDTLVGIINDLLDVERLESGSMPLDLTALSAEKIVESAIAGVASLAEAKGLMLLWNAEIDLPLLRGDEHKVRRVLINLLGNAVKFTPAGGSVSVDARVADDEASIVFSVQDTGEGIPADSFKRIFEKFGQAESRVGGRSDSTGLGLTFCKLAVEAHGGEIGVESAPGRGSRFWFTVPLEP